VSISPIKLDVRRLKGIIAKPDNPVSIDDMKKAIIAAATENK
jgi:hypothetical protein